MPNAMRLMVANWKMHKTAAEAAAFAAQLRRRMPALPAGCTVVIAPAFTALAAVSEAVRGSGMELGAQDLYWEHEGAFTGEVSGAMLAAAGCGYVIVGHSERREYFGETDATVNKKIAAALSEGLRPIVCVGETAQQRQTGETQAVLRRQTEAAFAGRSGDELARCIVAYEPVWAIGTGKTATPVTAQAAHAFVRKCVTERYGESVAAGLAILYGGSMRPENVAELVAQPDVAGGLVGTASLDADGFADLVLACGAQAAAAPGAAG